jgi:hypothetical protein
MFGIFKTIGQRVDFEAEMIPAVTASGFPFEKIFSLQEQGEHTSAVIKILEENQEPFNKYDFTVISYFLLAQRSRDIGLDGMLNLACCAYIISHMKDLNSYSRGILELLRGAFSEDLNSQEKETYDVPDLSIKTVQADALEDKRGKIGVDGNGDFRKIPLDSQRFKVNEKIVPKGTPTFTAPLKNPPQEKLERTPESPFIGIDKKREKKVYPSIRFHCPMCRVETSKSKLLKSDIGVGWKKCPFCNMNFQT